jgi:hypothetical protein
MNTDKHRFYIRKRIKDKKLNGTRMNTDTITIEVHILGFSNSRHFS